MKITKRSRSTKSYLMCDTVLPSHSYHILLPFIFLCLSLISLVHSDHTNPKIYHSLESNYYCFRRLNQTHQFGCASNSGGNYGIVKLIRPNSQTEDVEYLANSGPDPPYIAIIDVSQFSNITLLKYLKSIASTRVTGLVVLDQGRPSELSSDRSCPNEFSSLYVDNSKNGHCSSQQWNKPTMDHIEGMMYLDIPFPIFLIRNKEQIALLTKKISEKSTESWPKLAVQLHSPMHAAKDSITCLRRSSMSSRFNIYSDILCDPLGGFNLFHHTLDIESAKSIPKNSMVVLAARQDSFSMFESLAPGADSAISSLITLLAVAEMLNQDNVKKDILAEKNKSLMLALFDGEAFDYIGSSDTAYRMGGNNFPALDPFRVSDQYRKYPTLNLTHLSHFIELNQLSSYGNSKDDKNRVFLHKNLRSPPQEQTLLDRIIKESKITFLQDLNITVIPDDHPLPPSSAQSFLKKRKDDDFSVVVATNHENEYTNKFYNSFYEDGSDFSQDNAKRLTEIATLFGRVAYYLITQKSLEPQYTAKQAIVEGLLNCFLNNSNCELFQQVQDPTITPNSTKHRPPFSTYVSVYGVSNALREYTRLLLFRYTGEKVSANSSTECKKLGTDNQDKQSYYIWQNGPSMTGECIKSSAYMANTASPALNPDTLDVDSRNIDHYPLWTESKWQETSLRIFVVSSLAQKLITLFLGVLVLVLSFVVVIYLDRNAVLFFGDHRPKVNGNGLGATANRNHNPAYNGSQQTGEDATVGINNRS